jgi:S-adenosylmethionine hydrolase
MPRIYRETVTTPAAARFGRHGNGPFVSLLSDFGGRDVSAGIMRAVVVGICPRATIVDLSHDIDKFAIRDGALMLWGAAPHLPLGTHVAVIDPGVGTARKGIAMETARGDYLVGPDNGLLMPAAARLGGIVRVHLLENPDYALPEISSSFHGRDVFAPAAAHLADGLAIEELGRAVDPRRLLDLEWPRPDIRPGRLSSSAIYLDTFGNIKLSALADDLMAALPGLQFGDRVSIVLGRGGGARQVHAVWARTFGDVPEGAPLLTADSYGRVAVSVHQGSAASSYGIALDSDVDVTRSPTPGTSPGPGGQGAPGAGSGPVRG